MVDSDGAEKVLDPSMAVLSDRFFTPRYKDFCQGSFLNKILPLDGQDDLYVEHDCRVGPGRVGPGRVRVRVSLRPWGTAPAAAAAGRG